MKNKKKQLKSLSATHESMQREFCFLDKRIEKSCNWVEKNKNNIHSCISFIQAIELYDFGIDVTRLKPTDIKK
jgi:hypothetical protein